MYKNMIYSIYVYGNDKISDTSIHNSYTEEQCSSSGYIVRQINY